jgi:hypothetical protein
MSSILEVMSAGDEQRELYTIGSEKAAQSVKIVEAAFGKQDWNNFVAIGTPAFNAALQMTVVSAIYGVVPHYLHAIGARVAERKFHLDTNLVYEKMFTPVPDGIALPALPATARKIGLGINHCIAGLGGDQSVEDVNDVYFSADPAEAEAFFQLPEKRGAWKTYYAVSFHKDTKAVLRVKTYTYDHANGPGNWERLLELALLMPNET